MDSPVVESPPQAVATEVAVTTEYPSPLALPQAISSGLQALHGIEDEPRLATTSCSSVSAFGRLCSRLYTFIAYVLLSADSR